MPRNRCDLQHDPVMNQPHEDGPFFRSLHEVESQDPELEIGLPVNEMGGELKRKVLGTTWAPGKTSYKF